MRVSKLRIMMVFLLTVGIILVSGTVQAGEVTLKFAYVAPMGTLLHEVGVKFKEEVEKLSGGEIKVNLFPAGQLGPLPEMFGQLKKGTIDLFKTDLGVGSILTGSKSLSVVFGPYLFRSSEHLEKFCDSTIFKDLMGEIEKQNGIKYIGLLADRSPRALTTRQKMVIVPDDLKGVKIRVGEVPIFAEVFKKWAASLAVVPAAELYNSMKQKLVDGQDNGIDVVDGMKLYEVQHYYSAIDYCRSSEAIWTNQQRWNALTPAQQDIILKVTKIARDWGNQKLMESTLTWFDHCRDRGMIIVMPPLKPWIDSSRKVVAEQEGKMWPEGLYAKIQSIK